MQESNVILSIIIPTYNRSNILDISLNNITNESRFDDNVEIIISDNCSSDNTREIVEKYKKKYSNIFYYRNSSNIKDANYLKALSYGKGKYLKLLNDTHYFNIGMLDFMVCTINNRINEKDFTPLFFFQNEHNRINKEFYVNSIDECINISSFSITSTANFGIWRYLLYELKDTNKYIELQLAQVDWCLQVFNMNCSKTIIFKNFTTFQRVENKGGYNIFNVFVINYLYIYKDYLKNKQIKYFTYFKEKNKLFKYFILQWLIRIEITRVDEYNFKSENKWNTLFRYFWYNPYLYLIILFPALRILNRLQLFPSLRKIFKA